MYSLVFYLNIDSGPENLTGLSRNGLLLRNRAIAILERSRENITNRPQFFKVYTVIDHRNDVIKCSKLKWNHEPEASGFTAKFRTFYGVISMVYKSGDNGKLWSICFLQ